MARKTIKKTKKQLNLYIVMLFIMFIISTSTLFILKNLNGSANRLDVKKNTYNIINSKQKIDNNLFEKILVYFKKQSGITIVNFSTMLNEPFISLMIKPELGSREFIDKLQFFLKSNNANLHSWHLQRDNKFPLLMNIDIDGLKFIIKAGWKKNESKEQEKHHVNKVKDKKIYERKLPFVKKPKIAIVLDDAGGESQFQWLFLNIKYKLTFAVMPELNNSFSFSKRAISSGQQIILHAPMMPRDVNSKLIPKNVIRTGMKRHEVRKMLQKFLKYTKGAVGINNHMGSLATADYNLMKYVMGYLKMKKLYFLDSVTHYSSVAYQAGLKAKIKSYKRDIFLDHKHSYNYIKSRLFQLAKIAAKKGYAIGIGHVTNLATYQVLRDNLKDLVKLGFKFVFVSEL